MILSAPPVLDPYALFLRSRSAVSSAHYPNEIDYTIAIDGLDGTTPRTNHYRAIARPAQDVVRVAPISLEEAAAPPTVPHGVKVGIDISLSGGRGSGTATYRIPVGPSPASPDLLGVPLLAPSYMFGLAYAPPAHAAESYETPARLPVIAVVSSNARDYAVSLIDTPLLDATPTYHLRLTPLRKPKDNRLRELWIGAADYLPRKAVVSGNFTLAPLVDVPWTIDFSVVDGAPFVARETADATLFLAHRRVVRDARISFDDIHEADGSIVNKPLLEPDPTETTLVEPGT